MGDYSGKQANRSTYIKDFTYSNQNITWGYSNTTTLQPVKKTANVYIGGNLTVQGIFSNPSDISIKENIENLSLSLNENILNLSPKKYLYKNDENKKLHYGFIAQEVEEYFPNLVNELTIDGTTVKTVNYLEMIPLLISKMKDLQTQIDQLNNKLNDK